MHLEELGIPFTDMGDRKEIELFWHISQSLVSRSERDDVLRLIVTMTAAAMGSKICSIILLDEASGELRIAASQALSAAYLEKPAVKIGESVSGRAVKEKRPILVADVTKEPGYMYPEVAKAEGIVSMVSVPMSVSGRAVGVINSYTKDERAFGESDVKILQTVANVAAFAIENMRLRDENALLRRELDERAVVAQAKVLLMEKDRLTASQAADALEQAARDRGVPLVDVANAVRVAYSLRKG